MLDLNIWHATEEALVHDDVANWRKDVNSFSDETYIFYGYVPDSDDYDRQNLLKPAGFLSSGVRCMTIWQASDVNQDTLVDLLDHMHEREDLTFHVGLIRSSGADFAADVYEHEPEEMDYALADTDDPVRWADEYLQQWCNARLTDEAYDYLNLVAMSDFMLIATTVSKLYKHLGESLDDDEQRTVTLTDLDNVLSNLGEAQFFDMLRAIDDGNVETAANLALRMPANGVHGLISTMRNKMTVAMLRDGGFSLNEVHDAFRDHVAEEKEIEQKKQKLLSKGKDFNASDFEKIVKYKMSIKQAKFLYEKTPRYGSEQLKIIWNMIANTDEKAKSGRLSGTTVLEFATTLALVNKTAKKKKSRR